MKKYFQNPLLLTLFLGLILFVACKKDKLEVLSGFTYAVDATDFKKVTFTNAAQNYTSVSWDFGDVLRFPARSIQYIPMRQQVLIPLS
jgi:hypothetical protein